MKFNQALALVLFTGATVLYGLNTKWLYPGVVWAVVGLQMLTFFLLRPKIDGYALFPTAMVAMGGLAMLLKQQGNALLGVHVAYAVGTIFLLGLTVKLMYKDDDVPRVAPARVGRPGVTHTPMFI